MTIHSKTLSTVNDHPLRLFLDKMMLRNDLTAEDIDQLLSLPYEEEKKPRRSILMRTGDVLLSCSIVISGIAVSYKTTRGGGRQIVSVHFPGDTFDLQSLFLERSDHNTQAITAVDLLTIPRPCLQRSFMEFPNIARAITKDAQVEASVYRELIVNIGRRNAKQRLAHFLCEFALRQNPADNNNERSLPISLNQADLGDLLGLTSIHINRTLRELRNLGLIESDGKHIRCTNFAKLRDLSGFQDHYLHRCTDDIRSIARI